MEANGPHSGTLALTHSLSHTHATPVYHVWANNASEARESFHERAARGLMIGPTLGPSLAIARLRREPHAASQLNDRPWRR